MPPRHQQPLGQFCVSITCTRASIQPLSKELLAARAWTRQALSPAPTRPPAVIVPMARIGGDSLASVATDLRTDAKGSGELCESARHAEVNDNGRHAARSSIERRREPAMCNVIFKPFEF